MKGVQLCGRVKEDREPIAAFVAQKLRVTLVTTASRIWWRQTPERSELKREGEERN